MKSHTDPILQAYLNRLEVALAGVESADRFELLDRVREHYDAARRELPDPTDDQLADILHKLGAPEVVAREMLAVSTVRAADGPTVSSKTLWIPLALALAWPLGLVGLVVSSVSSGRERLLLAGVTLVGPLLFTGTFLSPAAFSPSGQGVARLIMGVLWSPATIGGLAAGLVLLRRHSQSAGETPSSTKLNVAPIMGATVLVWLALVFIVRSL